MAGSVSISSRNRSRGRTSVSVGSRATAVAERGAPSSRASSPKKSPGRTVARIASSPSSDGRRILTSPATTMNSASPGSPWWKMTSPRRNRRVRMPAANRSSAARSSPAKSWTRASASSRRPHPIHGAMVQRRCRRTDRFRVGAAVAAGVALADTRRVTCQPTACRRPATAFDMRLTVLGCGPAAPQPDTPASGLLVESGSTAILLDCGQGVAARLDRRIEPADLAAVIIGHMHADHFIDLAGLRYRFPWGERRPRACRSTCRPAGWPGSASWPASSASGRGSSTTRSTVREYDPAVPTASATSTSASCPGVTTSRPGGFAGRPRRDAHRVHRGHGTESRLVGSGRRRRPAGLRGDPRVGRLRTTRSAGPPHHRRSDRPWPAARARRLLITHYPSAPGDDGRPIGGSTA